MQTRIMGFLFLNLILLPLGASAQTEEPTDLTVLTFEAHVDGLDDDATRRIAVAVDSAAGEYDDWRVWEGLPTRLPLAEQYGCTDEMIEARCLGLIAEGRHALLIVGSIQRSSSDSDYGFIISVDLVSALDGGTILATVSERTEDHALSEAQIRALGRLIVYHLRETAGLSVEETEPTLPEDEPISEPPVPARRGLDFLSPLGWSLVAAGAASFAGLVGVWVRLNDLNNDPEYNAYRQMTPQGFYLCSEVAPDHVRSTCDEGTTLEIAQHVLLITSLILGGAGATALILDATGVGSVSLAPHASPTSAGLDLHLTF